MWLLERSKFQMWLGLCFREARRTLQAETRPGHGEDRRGAEEEGRVPAQGLGAPNLVVGGSPAHTNVCASQHLWGVVSV